METEAFTQDEVRELWIRERAYFISEGSDAGSPEDNWLRAERETMDAADLVEEVETAEIGAAPKKPKSKKS